MSQQTYTDLEKQILLKIVERNKNISKEKDITDQFSEEKQQTWLKISQEYNSVAVSGDRTWHQLRNLYETLKQKEHKEKQTNIVDNIVNIKGFFNNNVLTNVQPKVESNESFTESNKDLYFSKGDSDLSEVLDDSEIGDQYAVDTDNSFIQITRHSVVKFEENIESSASKINLPNVESIIKTKKLSGETLRRKYFQAKLNNTLLERNFMIEKHKLEMQILQKKLFNISTPTAPPEPAP